MNDPTDVELFPEISPNDYAAFRKVLGDHIPNTYNEWLNLQTKEIREYIQAGRHTKNVPINPHEFAGFLAARGANANLVSLRNCVIEKEAGHRY